MPNEGAPADYRVEDGVAVVVLDNPPLNVLSLAMTSRLDDIFDELREDAVRVVVITGAGERAFCAGADIKEFVGLAESGTVIDVKLAKENRVYNKIAEFPKPIIAAINGDAFGGGTELALCCDLRIAAEGARFGLPECKLGVIPGAGGTQRLPRLIGTARAKELMYTGDFIDAATAERIGLVNRVVKKSELDTVVRELAAILAARPAVALAAIKEAVDYGIIAGEAAGHARALELSERVFASDDMREGVQAFFEKRRPNFKHR